MRLLQTTSRNLGLDAPGRSAALSIDYTALPGPVTLFHGPNGAGKSTAMGLWQMAVYAQHPDYGPILGLVPLDGGPSEVVARFNHGGHVYEWTRRMERRTKADGLEAAPTHTVTVTRDGEPVCSGVTEGKTLATSLFGTYEEWSMIFVQRQRTAEGRGKVTSPTGATPDARGQFVEACIGVSPTRRLSEVCAAKAADARKVAEALRPDYERLQAAREKRAAQLLVVAEAEAAAQAAAAEAEAAGRRLAAAEALCAGIEARAREAARHDEVREAAAKAGEKATATATESDAAKRRAEECRVVSGRAADALAEAARNVEAAKLAAADVASAQERRRDAQRGAEDAAKAVAKCEAELAAAQSATIKAQMAADAAERDRITHADHLRALTEAADRAAAEERDANTAVRAIADEFHAEDAERAEAQDAHTRAVEALREADRVCSAAQAAEAEARRRRDETKTALAHGEAHATGRCPECGQSVPVEAALAKLPGLREAAEAAEAAAATATSKTERNLYSHIDAQSVETAAREVLSACAARLDSIRQRGVPAKAAWQAAQARATEAKAAATKAAANTPAPFDAGALPRAEANAEAADRALTAARARHAEAAARLAALPPASADEAARLSAVTEAEAAHARAQTLEAQARAEVQKAGEAAAAAAAIAQAAREAAGRAQAEAAALPEPNAPTAIESDEAHGAAFAAKGDKADADDAARFASAAHAEARGALSQIDRDIEALAPKAADLEAASTEARRWELLRSLLRDLIVRKIEASAGEINDLVNAQLRGMWGARFSIDFQALRRNRTVDTYEAAYAIYIVDHETGNRREFDGWSGGQQTPAGSALRNGLVKFYNRHCHRLGRDPFETLFVDEYDAALSDDAKPEFQVMLREFAADAGLDRICVISHTPEFDADSRVDPRDHMTEIRREGPAEDKPKRGRKGKGAKAEPTAEAEAAPVESAPAAQPESATMDGMLPF